MAERPAAPDEAARQRVRADLSSTLFVEAGAGSGKTTALVRRIVGLVADGTELRHVAAITFTDKAGAELRDRLRDELELESLTNGDATVRARCQAGLDQLDGAAIGTLHAFAQRLLSTHPIEAGLPPRVEVLDEVASGVAFDDYWLTTLDRLLDDPALERTLLLLTTAGVQPGALRALAAAFDDNWDLVAERVPPDEAEPPSVLTLGRRALDAFEAVLAERHACTKADDKLFLRLDGELTALATRLRAFDDEIDLLDALDPNELPTFRYGNVGSKTNWPDVVAMRDAVVAAGKELLAVRDDVARACAHRVGSALRVCTLEAARQRQGAGRLLFHDLLVMARALLRHPTHGASVRATLHDQYRHLLLDEFQDTDPIQIELAVRIAAADPASPAAAAATWDEVAVAPGHLFVVGDPKQSIYRFRRADIGTFLTARRRYGSDGGLVELTANFRTVAPIIEWVNTVFAALMGEAPEVDTPVASRPDYVALDAVRPALKVGPAVAVVGRAPHPARTKADALRGAEAADVAAVVRRVLDEGWTVQTRTPGGDVVSRPARLGDITVLVPARTSLPFLEDALTDAGIAYRAESSSLVYATRAVRDLLMVLRAIDDPTDHLSVVSALRTPLFGCGDDDLFRFRHERGGRWDYLGHQPDTMPVDDVVEAGLAYLRARHDERYWCSPSELLATIARDRRAFELGFAEGRPRDVWRRLRFVIDQARAWSESAGGSLRHYLAWVDQQAAEGSRVTEALLPETDDDAVRIMTIHASKGLEFPVTVVSGLSTVPQARPSPAEVVFPPAGGVGYRLGAQVRTQEYVDWKPIDEQMGYDERVRLLYVACTRAADHLVVSLHRAQRAKPVDHNSKRTNAELLERGMGDAVLAAVPDGVPTEPRLLLGVGFLGADPATAPAPFAEWEAERAAALARAARPTAVAATALTDDGHPDQGDALDGLRKQPRDLDLPPWMKGRYGTAVGRAVHGVLQSVDLATGAGVDAAVAAQCEAEAVVSRAADVRRLVDDALAAPSVREAATHTHWREVYACTPVDGGRLLEGYVDLLYRTADGLVVVDYKTSASADPAELDRRVEGYRTQGASYALTVAAVTGEPVVRVTFLFLTPKGPVERHLHDLPAAVAEARALVQAGRDVIVVGADD